MSALNDDLWTCPTCEETVRGDARDRLSAQLDHADTHRTEANAAQAAQDEDDAATERATYRAEAHARKVAARRRGGRDAR